MMRVLDRDGQCVDVKNERIARILALVLAYTHDIEAAERGRIEINFAGTSLSANLVKSLPLPH